MRRKRLTMHMHLRQCWREGDRNERGVVLAFLALVLFTLIVMAGFTVDVANWWWTGQKLQRTADAAALGGVVYMPDDPAKAGDVTRDLTKRNGYTNGTNATVTAEPGDRPTRLRVTVVTKIDNFFAGIIGFRDITITRTAVADYAGAVPMGSPASYLGNDPELGPSDPARLQKLWINIAGRNATKISGDHYTAGRCSTGSETATNARQRQPGVPDGLREDVEPRVPVPRQRRHSAGGSSARDPGVRPGVHLHR